MFSTSITASSTTTPSATARPPSVMVLMAQPRRSITITAVSSESGIETNDTSTVRRSRMKANSTSAISTAPIIRSSPMPPSAVVMKLAGRCRPPVRTTPWASSDGFSSARVASTAWVARRVLAPYWLAMATITPGLPMIRASPVRGVGASRTVARSPICTVEPSLRAIGAEATSAAERAWPEGATSTRCCSVSMKPPPETPVEFRTAPIRSLKARPRAARASGRATTSMRRIWPPNTVALATPVVDSRRGRTTVSTRVRKAIGLSLSLVKPILSRSMVEEVRGCTAGALTPFGSSPAVSATASDTTWRAR